MKDWPARERKGKESVAVFWIRAALPSCRMTYSRLHVDTFVRAFFCAMATRSENSNHFLAALSPNTLVPARSVSFQS